MANIYLSIPNSRRVDISVLDSVVNIISDKGPELHTIFKDFKSGKPMEHCLNEKVERFLCTDCEYFLTIDSDNPPTGNPLRYLDPELDIQSFPTPTWRHQGFSEAYGWMPITLNAFDKVEGGYKEHFPQDGLQEVDAVGNGCVLIHRRVLEQIKPAFVRKWNDNGTTRIGSDLNLCERAKFYGFKIWANYDCCCSHLQTIDLLQVRHVINKRAEYIIGQKKCLA